MDWNIAGNISKMKSGEILCFKSVMLPTSKYFSTYAAFYYVPTALCSYLFGNMLFHQSKFSSFNLKKIHIFSYILYRDYCPKFTASTQVGTLVSDVSRVLVVLVIILLAFATSLACVGTEQVKICLD